MADEKTDQDDVTIPKEAFAQAKDQIRKPGENFKRVYVNNAAIAFSSFDMSISFGEIIGEENGQSVIEESVQIILTREFAKVLTELLVNNLKAFESQFGEIKIPVLKEDTPKQSDEQPRLRTKPTRAINRGPGQV